MIISCNVVSQACPKCSFPVTFGGGITIQNGYIISNGADEIKFQFDAADNSWSAVHGEEVTKLMTIDAENNSAELYLLSGETMEVELNDAGLNIARQAIVANSFAAK